MAHMLLLSLTVNQYIIKVHHKFIDKWLKQLSHHSPEGARSIGQFKGHNQPYPSLILNVVYHSSLG